MGCSRSARRARGSSSSARSASASPSSSSRPRPGRLDVAVHCGAQTTAETVALCEHAAGLGVAAVAVIAPPYFPLDDDALLAHFTAAAAACAPTPFYVYEFAKTSGYAVPPDVVRELRERAPNLAGSKVSDAPWDRFEPYLIEGLDVFVGPEALITQGIGAGAIGAVSALATAFPEHVAACVREPTDERAAVPGGASRGCRALPAPRDAQVRARPPRRRDRRGRPGAATRLTADERAEMDRLLPSWLDPLAD